MAVIFLDNELSTKSGKILVGWIIIEQFSELAIGQLGKFGIHIADSFKQRLDCEWVS